MKTIITILVVGIVIAGCVGGNFVKSEPRKYLQGRNPFNKTVVVSQWETPDESLCLNVIASMKFQKNPGAEYMYCNSTSSSSALPYAAKVKHKTLNAIIDYEYFTLDFCEGALKDVIDNIEVLVPCHKK